MSSLMFSAILALLLLAIFEVVEPIVQDLSLSGKRGCNEARVRGQLLVWFGPQIDEPLSLTR